PQGPYRAGALRGVLAGRALPRVRRGRPRGRRLGSGRGEETGDFEGAQRLRSRGRVHLPGRATGDRWVGLNVVRLDLAGAADQADTAGVIQLRRLGVDARLRPGRVGPGGGPGKRRNRPLPAGTEIE